MKMSELEIEERQRAFCRERQADYLPSPSLSKLGFALTTRGRQPINGLRNIPEAGTNGWYLWCGEEYSTDSNFFQPLHVQHVYDEFSQLISLLGLSPGHRFLLSGDYLDVWYDQSLLTI